MNNELYVVSDLHVLKFEHICVCIQIRAPSVNTLNIIPNHGEIEDLSKS